MEKNNNKIVVTLLIIIIIVLAILCVLFATDVINLNINSTNNNNQTTNNNQIIDNNQADNDIPEIIKTKLVDNLNNGNSETTFNGITVVVKQDVEDMICNATCLTINGNDVLQENASCIKSYEFYDDNVIIMSNHTSGNVFTIYNVPSKKTIVKYSGSESGLEGYFVESYSTNNNIITINASGCGAQCGQQNVGEKAIFEIEYLNNIFSEHKLINKTN